MMNFPNLFSKIDERFAFLKHIVNWLHRWQCRQGKHGKLSPQTFTSLSHSCRALIEIVQHLMENCGFDYPINRSRSSQVAITHCH